MEAGDSCPEWAGSQGSSLDRIQTVHDGSVEPTHIGFSSRVLSRLIFLDDQTSSGDIPLENYELLGFQELSFQF